MSNLKNGFSPNMIDPILLTDSYLNKEDWRIKENSTSTYSIGGLILHQAGTISANYWLNKVYPEDIGNAHKSCDLHIHDLQGIFSYCAGWSIATILEEGVGGVRGKINSGPPKHLNTAVQQLVNFLGILQNEWSGAQALNGFDTYLAPFIRKDNMTHEEVVQCLQFFCFSMNVPSRWGCFDLDTLIEAQDEIIQLELEDGTLKEFKRNDRVNTKNRGVILAKDLSEEDELDI